MVGGNCELPHDVMVMVVLNGIKITKTIACKSHLYSNSNITTHKIGRAYIESYGSRSIYLDLIFNKNNA